MYAIVVQLYRDNHLLAHSRFYCKIHVKYGFIAAPLMHDLQALAPSQHLYDVMFDKEPVSLRNQRGCNWAHDQTQGVSTFSVQGHRCIRGYGDHTPCWPPSPGRCDLRAGSYSPCPSTIISLATLPCWCWWWPWTNTAIWIQLEEFSALRASVRASPRAE